ncbi:MAG: hypothetical protein KA423_01395 [Candidatus Planktophila sp.]|jgi:hypothetical protein|nr:hypothetical protein [Candidatus Planktophila sp.]MBP7903021.1 hypothetical protein [Candidatus Planktophila sp.]
MSDRDSRPDSGDEQELINAEFEAMVSGLNLDQSSPRTYLDELAEIEKSESAELFLPPRTKRGLHGTVAHISESIKRWWKRPHSQGGTDDGDGAIV